MFVRIGYLYWSMKKYFSAVLIFLIVFAWSRTIPQFSTPQQSTSNLPTLVFLGEGANTYTNDPGWDFIVKHSNPFALVFEPGPTYTANATDRVWRSQGTGGAPPAAFHNDIVVGTVAAGCIVRYVAIDDDIDGRFNSFFLNGTLIHTITEGMVTTGEFVIPSDGVLSYEANDSIGMYLDVCGTSNNSTPGPTPTDTPNATPTETSTPNPLATATATSTQTSTPGPLTTPSVTPDGSQTPNPLETPTGTQTPNPLETPTTTPELTPDLTITVTPVTPVVSSPVPGASQTPEPTHAPPREKSCLRINFEVGGDEARNGRYEVIEAGGRVLAAWDAQDGWKDSGWIRDIELTYRSVYVQVVYYPPDSSDSITMRIVNPAPGTDYGWLSEGMCHAIEVAWP